MRRLQPVEIYSLFIVAALNATGWAQPPAAGPPLVAVGTVTRERVAEEQLFIGTLQAARHAVVGSAVEGRVADLRVQPGDRIRSSADGREADVLAMLETEMLEIEIEAARIQQQLAERAADELATALPAEIDTAASRLSEARARVDYAQQELERLRRLASAQITAVAQLELDLAVSQLAALAETVRQAEIDHERLVATRGTREMQARLRAQAAQQEVLRLEDLRSRYTVRAPFDGYVVNKFTDVGAWLAKGAPVVEVVQIDTLDFVFSVPQEVAARLQLALADSQRRIESIGVVVEGWEEPLTAQLLGVVPLADARARTLPVRAKLVNPQINGRPALQPGMIGRAAVPVGVPRESLFVPKDALVLQGGETAVFAIASGPGNPVARRVVVQTGMRRGPFVEVMGDLNAGEQVIVMGNERLRGGEVVRIQPGAQ